MIRFDISPPLSPGTAVWPGDRSLEREMVRSHEAGDGYDLSTLVSTVHIGAHADAPRHFGPDRPGMDRVDLEPYMGPCSVIHAIVGRGELIEPDAIPDRLVAPRLLFRTETFPDPDSFNEDFAALSPDLVDAAADRGAVLLGIDTPSVDPFDSRAVPAHRRMLDRGIAGLEGLDLRTVPEGSYGLVALPLRLVGFDASPVRAVLTDL